MGSLEGSGLSASAPALCEKLELLLNITATWLKTVQIHSTRMLKFSVAPSGPHSQRKDDSRDSIEQWCRLHSSSYTKATFAVDTSRHHGNRACPPYPEEVELVW